MTVLRSLRAPAALAVTIAIVVATAASGAAAKTCNATPHNQNKGLIVVVSATGISCTAAAKDVGQRAAFPNSFKTGLGYRCNHLAKKVKGSSQWRCTKGTKSYRVVART